MNTTRRWSGLVRLALALFALGALVVVAVTLSRLNTRLSAQDRANRQTVTESQAIVAANERITTRLNQLSALSVMAQSALSGTGTIAGVLTRLDGALTAAKQSAGTGHAGATATQSGLDTIAALVNALNTQTAAMVNSSSHLIGQEAALVAVLRGIVADLTTSVADVARIQHALAGLP